jgi:hypothetical protein
VVPHREREPEYSYAGLVLGGDHAAITRELTAVGFSGWIGPDEAGWVVLVCRRLTGAVTAKGHDITALGAHLARATGGPAVAAHVRQDRLLTFTAWHGDAEIGRYLSNPAFGADEDDDFVDPEPEGVEYADAIATAFGRADEQEELAEILGEILDEEEQTESERLWSVLRLLGVPSWLVASAALPKDVLGGPLKADVVLLFRGRTGRLARVAAWLTGRQRRRRR